MNLFYQRVNNSKSSGFKINGPSFCENIDCGNKIYSFNKNLTAKLVTRSNTDLVRPWWTITIRRGIQLWNFKCALTFPSLATKAINTWQIEKIKEKRYCKYVCVLISLYLLKCAVYISLPKFKYYYWLIEIQL